MKLELMEETFSSTHTENGKVLNEIEIAKTQRNKVLLFSFAEHVYIEMLSLNSEVTRNTSSSKYDIK